jgi:penicillin amidase
MKLAHPIGRLPWQRRAAQVARFPVGGSNETVMKTSHPYTDWKHATHFGQNARFVADLADIDANEFVLLGGQDGWLRSRTIGDQVPLWRAGRLIRVPLAPEAVAGAFPKVTTIAPGSGRAPAQASHAA